MTLSKRMLRRPWCADPGCDHRAIAQAGICAARENAEHLVVKRARLLHAALRLRRVGDAEQLASGRHADASFWLSDTALLAASVASSSSGPSQFQPLGPELHANVADAGGVAARPVKDWQPDPFLPGPPQ